MNISLKTVSTQYEKHQYLSEILAKVKEKFRHIYQENLIDLVLFGSQARGEAKPESDIDILVILKDPKNLNNNHEKILELISELSIEYGVLVSCIYVSESQFKQEKSPLLLNIHKEGIFL